MKNLKRLILGLCGILTVSFFSCQNDDVSDSYGTDDSEEVFTVTEVVTTKGNSFISGTGTYKTGNTVTLVAPPYAHITGDSDKGQTIDVEYDVAKKDGNNAEAKIYEINANWTVRWEDETPSSTITFEAGPGGSISSPKTVSGIPGSKASGPTATADPGYSFKGWSDGCTTATWSGTIPSTGSAVTAKFEMELSIPDCIFVGDNGVILSQGIKYVQGETNWNSIVHGNGKYIAVGQRGYMTVSSDGRTWSTPDIIGNSADWYSIVFANGKYVAAGNGYVAVSTDGTNWTINKISNTNNRTWNDVQYCNGRFIVVGNNGYMATSTDGGTWKESKIGNNDLKSVTYGNGRYVVTEKSGYVNHSTDLAGWNRVKITVTELYSSAFGNNKFIVSSYGCMHYSTDGINWEEVTFGDNSWKEVIFWNNSFLALENNGYIGISVDGISWKITKITDSNGAKLGFLNGFCTLDR